jgi:hypothetical protein
VAVAVAVFALTIGGCGGGDGGADSSASTTHASVIPTVTAPQVSTVAPEAAPDSGGGSTGTSQDAASGSGGPLRSLRPFYDCLARHGVAPSPPIGTSLRGSELHDPDAVQKELRAKAACVRALPPSFESAGELLKRRARQVSQ